MTEDKRYNFLTWIVGIIFAVFVGVGGVSLISFGHMKHEVEDIIESVNFISRDYVPMWYLEGLQKNTNLQTEEIVATIKEDNEKVKEINEKYLQFQKTMLNNFIQTRGGRTNITRSAKPDTLNSIKLK